MKKYITIVILGFILISCGTKKKVTNESISTTQEIPIEVIVAESSEIKEEIIVEEVEIEVEEATPIENLPLEEHITAIDDSKQDLIAEKFDHSSFDVILKKYVTKDGVVNYAGIKKNRKSLTDYIASFKSTVPTNSWNKEDKLAYYMNAYNAMTIDLILRSYPLKSIKDIKGPWDQRYWQIGDKWVNLEEIEHKILRKMNDPRIHFGINCASFSCPPLLNEAFTASLVDNQLEKLAIGFVNDSKRNTITEGQVEISNIFKWFKKDFTTNGDIIDFLNKYSTIKIKNNARVRYADYNWELNE